MRRIVIGVAVVLTTAGLANAETERDRVMTKIADVIAIQQVCTKLKPNMSIVGIGVAAFKINMDEGSADFLWLQKEARDKIAMLRQKGGEDLACLTGRTLYGPNGLNGPNLMQEK